MKTPENIADKKLHYVKKCIIDTLNNEDFVVLMRNVFRDVKQKNIVNFLWKYQNNLHYTPENKGDYCKDGIELLKSRIGDCEDFTVFNYSIFRLFGVDTRIKVTDTFNTGYYTHILVQFYNDRLNKWISFDGTYRKEGIGGEPEHFKSRYYYT